MILKILLVGAVILTVYYFFIKKKPLKKKDQDKVSELIECSTCSTYIELDEAILSGGKYFCCKECVK